jgi:adenosylcobinamide amidohydrolase
VLSEPLLTTRDEDGAVPPLLCWRAHQPVRAVSSAPLGGGLGERHWVVNATVSMSYRRLDPAVHLSELAARLGLSGPGVGLLTGVDVAEVVHRAEAGVRIWATVGLGTPVLAAEPGGPVAGAERESGGPVAGAERRARTPLQAVRTDVEGPGFGTDAEGPVPADAGGPGSAAEGPGHHVGTVNVVAWVPVRLSDAALVNAIATATEAKVQAIRELALPGTGTPTDAVTVLCPCDGPVVPYGGPRSEWGAPLARAVHAALLAGGSVPVVPWSEQPDRAR